MKKRNTIFLVLSGLFLAFPVFAAVSIPTVAGIPKDANAAELVTYFFNLAVTVGSFIAVIMLIMAGIDYVISQGNPSKIEDAKKRIQNTLLGVFILMASLIILNIINPDLAVIKINNLSQEQQPGVNVPESKTIGVYLYKADGSSLNIKTATPSLVEQGFQNQTQSVKFENPDGYKYGAVLFSDSDLKGNCVYALNDVNDLGSANGGENYPPIGKNEVSSALVLKTVGGSPSVTLYNTVNCGKRSDEYGKVEEKTSVCTVSANNGFKNIKEACPDLVGDVLSIGTSPNTGILLKASNKDSAGRCQFFTSGTASCVNVVKYSFVYDRSLTGAIKPLSYMLFSLYPEL